MENHFSTEDQSNFSSDVPALKRRHFFLIGIFGLLVIIGFIIFLVVRTWGQEPSGLENRPQIIPLTIQSGESVAQIAERLKNEGLIRSSWVFRRAAAVAGIDTKIQVGEYMIERPITISRIIEVLSGAPARAEKTITIIPGWSIRDVATYLEKEGWGKAEDVFALTGTPAKLQNDATGARAWWGESKLLTDKPRNVSIEGYLAPDTYQVFADATLTDILGKLIDEREKQFTGEMYAAIVRAKRTPHEILTMASFVEMEVRRPEDRTKVADIFWRRVDAGWGLQADSSVHYVVGKSGSVFTTAADRATNNPWNTYKYAGLPPGPIANPSLGSIQAAITPELNDFWYFLTDLEGSVHYAKDLDEHNRNRAKYL